MDQHKSDEGQHQAPKTGSLKVAEVKHDGAAAQVDEAECAFGNTPSGTDVDVQVRNLWVRGWRK